MNHGENRRSDKSVRQDQSMTDKQKRTMIRSRMWNIKKWQLYLAQIEKTIEVLEGDSITQVARKYDLSVERTRQSVFLVVRRCVRLASRRKIESPLQQIRFVQDIRETAEFWLYFAEKLKEETWGEVDRMLEPEWYL